MQDTDEYLNTARLSAMLGVSSMTLYRWTMDEQLDFPPPSEIHGRKYWSRAAIARWMKDRAIKKSA